MKTALMFIACAFVSSMATAQQNQHKKQGKTSSIKTFQKPTAAEETVVSLNSTTANAAFADRSLQQNLRIADPTIRWYNSMYDYRHPGGNAVIGVPKLSNGIAHGRIIFYPTNATGTGSFTGSGSVGTGTSLGNVGSNGAVIGVNGKNPYAGPGIYGSRVLSDLREKDRRQ